MKTHPLAQSSAEKRAAKPGDRVPGFRAALLDRKRDAAYLGLPDGEAFFSMNEARAPYLLVDFFDVACPVCVKQVEVLTDFYDRIEADPELHGKIKIIGVADRDANRAVAKYRKERATPFPLFADPDGGLFAGLTMSRHPSLVLAGKTADGAFEVLLVAEGYLESREDFFRRMTDLVRNRTP